MKIGEVIRKYRKEKEMTQEQMARGLGVTASAVNKWENHAAYPDIALLSPIARMLHITLDTLLSYEENLTEEEIQHFVTNLNEKLENEKYDHVFQWAKSQIEIYPNSETLIFRFV